MSNPLEATQVQSSDGSGRRIPNFLERNISIVRVFLATIHCQINEPTQITPLPWSFSKTYLPKQTYPVSNGKVFLKFIPPL